MSIGTLRAVPLERSSFAQPEPAAPRNVLLVVTVGRLVLAGGMATAYLAHGPLVAVALLAAFIVVDLADGDIARRLGAETGLRRLADGTVDRLSVHLMLAVVSTQVHGIVMLWMLLAARDLTQAAVGVQILRRRHIVVAGAPWHRSYTLGLAVWGSLVMLSGVALVPLGSAVAAIGVATLIDYLRRANRASVGAAGE